MCFEWGFGTVAEVRAWQRSPVGQWRKSIWGSNYDPNKAGGHAPQARWIVWAHLRYPGRPARVAGQEKDRSKKYRDHAFGSTDDATVREGL
jgi:hypothetical protein